MDWDGLTWLRRLRIQAVLEFFGIRLLLTPGVDWLGGNWHEACRSRRLILWSSILGRLEMVFALVVLYGIVGLCAGVFERTNKAKTRAGHGQARLSRSVYLIEP